MLGLVVVATCGAVYLTSMLFDARGAWLQRVEERQARLAQQTEDLRLKRLAVADLEDQVNRVMGNWGRVWNVPAQAPGNQVVPGQATITLGIGTSNGLGTREQAQGKPLPTIHVFAVEDAGASKYLGEFRITAVEPNRVAAQLTRAPYPGEVQQWPPAARWRVWQSIPANWRTLAAEQQGLMAVAMQDVQDQQVRLDRQQTMIVKSQSQLDRRMKELNGNGDAITGSSEDVINGLVETFRREETARNVELAQLDVLRHEYTRKYRELTDLIEQNRNLVARLPQPAPASAPSGSSLSAEAQTHDVPR
jgi:hypothetical protein